MNKLNPKLEELVQRFTASFDKPYEVFGREVFLAQAFNLGRQSVIDDLETNPNPDGSISPNIQHWIEQKQIQLRQNH